MFLFADSFGHYNTANIDKKWTSHANGVSPTIISNSAPVLRTGASYIHLQHAQCEVKKNLPDNYGKLIVGFRYLCDSLPAAAGSFGGGPVLLALYDGGYNVLQVVFALSTTGQIAVWRLFAAASAGTYLGASSGGIVANIPAYLEFSVDFTIGEVVIRKNNIEIFNASGLDLTASPNAYASTIGLGLAAAGNSHAGSKYCDLYVLDDSGAYNNSFLGDIRIDPLFPIADVQQDFTPSTGVNHYALVDETTPDETDYNDGASVGDRDSYNFETVPPLSGATIYGVQVCALMKKTDAGSKNAATMAHSVASTHDGDAVGIGTLSQYIHQVHERDPNGSAAWTESSINAADFGVVVTA